MARNTRRKTKDHNKSHKKTKREINVIDNRKADPRSDRHRRKRKDLEKKYRRRRIGLGLIVILILILAVNFISSAINSYKILGYPPFRDEVLESIGEDVFISSSDGRSLSTAEKIADFDNLTEIIDRNYAVDKQNIDYYKDFRNKRDDYRKRIYSSKTDHEYFDIIDQYLGLLNDNRTFIINKEIYDNLFDYYRKSPNSYRKAVLENPQAVDRYKRLIEQAATPKPSMELTIEKPHILRMSLADFKASEFDKDLEKLVDLYLSNPPITNIILDLRDTNSIDDIYANKLAEVLLHNNYNENNIMYYRGWIFKNTLDNLKDIENSVYESAAVANDATRNVNNNEMINENNYQFYDELRLNIDKDMDFSDRNIYVLTNANTANAAIKLADILQKDGAYVVKNGLDSNPTSNDIIYNMRPDLEVLEHSGLILSINSAYSKNDEEDLYLKYNEKINSRDPVSTMLNIIN